MFEEFIERVGGLRAEPRSRSARARALGPGCARKTRTAHRAAPIRHSGRAAHSRRRKLKFVRAAPAAPRAASPCGSIGERKKLLFGQAQQRALQHARKREIVFGHQQRVGERHQVHHRDVLGEHQPVRARDRDAFLLQLIDDRVEQRAALAHQHENVARGRGVAHVAVADEIAARDPCLTACAILRASRTRGLVSAPHRTARPSLRCLGFSSGSIIGHSSTSPGALARTAACAVSAGTSVRPA